MRLMSSVFFFANNFTDVNYLAPLALDAAARGERLQLIFYGPDLKRASKVFFKQHLPDIITWPFLATHQLTVLTTPAQLTSFWQQHQGIVVSTTPTLHHLLAKQYLTSGSHQLIGLAYFYEFAAETAPYLTRLFLPSPLWDTGYPAAKVRYGLPYWDLFAKRDWLDQAPPEAFVIDQQQPRVVLPEITQEGDQWFDQAATYIEQHYQPETQYYLKYRLKTKQELKRNQQLERRLKKYGTVTPVYSPYVFTTARLLENATVVFTASTSLFIAECIAAGAKVVKVFDHTREVWPIKESNYAVENYLADPAGTRERFFSNLGQSTELFWRELKSM